MNDFKETWNKADKQLRNEYGVTGVQTLTWATMAWLYFGTALVQAKRKNWPAALFFALLWQGHTSNVSDIMAHKQRQILAKSQKFEVDPFHQMFGSLK